MYVVLYGVLAFSPLAVIKYLAEVAEGRGGQLDVSFPISVHHSGDVKAGKQGDRCLPSAHAPRFRMLPQGGIHSQWEVNTSSIFSQTYPEAI